MAQSNTKIIKHLLYTWFEEVEDPMSGGKALRERIARLGDKVTITRHADVVRGERLGSFYTDSEAKAIEDGTYNGSDAEQVFAARSGVRVAPRVAPADGEHGDFAMMDAPQLADHIASNKLNVQNTLALLPADADAEDCQKLLDAENIATGNDPRTGVVDVLEKRISES